MSRLLPLVLALLVASPVRAETSVGLRIGGYGFRQPGFAGGWQDCRMNGAGLFLDRALARHVELQVGLDGYFAAAEAAPHDHGAMDRVSLLAGAAGALRPFPGARVSPYVQLGAGLELTRVTVDAVERAHVLPFGFLGAGGDVRLGGRVRAGAVLRLHVMGHFHDDASSAAPELASQLQFYVAASL